MKLALAGDTMLGRKVGERLREDPGHRVFDDRIGAVAGEADLFIVNLECAVSERGERWPDPSKQFFFRAPPAAVEQLHQVGVGCVTLANNHALDYGPDALLDTLTHLDAAGIAHTGAGRDEHEARRPALLDLPGGRLAVVGVTDHPAEFAATRGRPGVAFADLERGVPGWLHDLIGGVEADVVLVTPHWGPNMVPAPVPHVRAAASTLRQAGATVVAGHSAHVFHGVQGAILYDIGDFADDYATHPLLRNDLGLLFLVTIEGKELARIEAVPLVLEYCHTRLAEEPEATWIEERFRQACRELGTEVTRKGDRLVIERIETDR